MKKFLIASIVSVALLGSAAFIGTNDLIVAKAEEPPVVETSGSTENTFEQVVYTNEEAHLKITLTSETECSIEMINDGETRVKDNVPYSIVENELTIVLNEQNFTFVIGENNTLTPKEIEPVEPIEPQEPVVPENPPTEFVPKTEWGKKLWAFLNAPLPIVGFSLLMILSWLTVFFVKSSFGKKQIKKMLSGFDKVEKDYGKTKEEYEAYCKKQDARIDELEAYIKKYDQYFITICDNSRNAKIKEMKGEFVHEEEREETTNTSSKEA